MGRGRRHDPRSNDLLHQGLNVLAQDIQRGYHASKHYDKQIEGGMDGKIYANKTLHDYQASWRDFCGDLASQGIKCKTLEDAVQYVPGYLERLSERPGRFGGTMSAWTIRARFAAVGKVLGLTASDYDLPTRHRADIQRSRGERAGDKHFSKTNNAALIDFCCGTGLRNQKELQNVRGTDLIQKPDGSYAIHVPEGKGGKERYADVIGSPERIASIVSRMEAAGENKVWPKVHSNADIHGYRAQYAKDLYAAIARPIDQIPRSERYYCRADRAGVVYDRVAMAYVSKQMGHSRISVIAEHYL